MNIEIVHRRASRIAAAVFAANAIAMLPSGAQQRAKIVVGPNILVTDDGIVPHIEPHLAVHPANSKVLVGTVTVQRETDHVVAAYASKDGGYSWAPSALPLKSAGDPQVAIGKSGTVY